MLKQAENVQYTYRELVIEQHLDSISVEASVREGPSALILEGRS